MTSGIRLVSVNVGKPQVLGEWRGREIISSIAKWPVAATQLELTTYGLVGNQQADLRVHGGTDKAVYAYPSTHLREWSLELGRTFGPGSFGENLTISGLTEGEVRVGDQWAWGAALLEVTKPRQPCYKLIMHTGVEDIIQRMRRNLMCGWYLRVLKPGLVPVSGPFQVLRFGDGPTIREVFAEKASRPLSVDFLG